MRRFVMWGGAALLALVVYLGLAPASFAQDVGDVAEETVSVPNANAAMWSGIVGAFMPLAIAAVNRYRWTSMTKGLVTFVLCLAAALGTTYFAGDLDGEDYVVNSLIVLSAATASYQFYWKPTTIAPKIEQATG